MLRLATAVVVALVGGCGPESGMTDGDAACEVGEPGCEPKYSACFPRDGEDDVRSCQDLCAERGGICAAESCEGLTYMRFLGCEDEVNEGGSPFMVACDTPIDWGLSDAVQCCCAGIEE